MAAKINSKRVKLIKQTIASGSDEYFCCFCLKVFPLELLTIEHIYPKSFGGTNELVNLTLSCEKCNHDRDSLNFSAYRDYKMGLVKKKPNGTSTTNNPKRRPKKSKV